MNVVILTSNFRSNSLGRAYCLWLLCRSLGWDVSVLSPQGDALWAPLAGTAFAQDCDVAGDRSFGSMLETVRPADLVIAAKPLPESFGVALELSRVTRRPLLLDIDDPDIEHQLSWGDPVRRAARAIWRRERVAELKQLRSAALRTPTIASNPTLAGRWRSTVVPHVREDPGLRAGQREDAPTIAFVGTDKPHKGLDVLRAAVARTQDHGFRLVVTDVPPPDPKPWEQWIGTTTFDRGLDVAGTADIVALPSRPTVYSRAQLPVKLVDGMMLGRTVVVSDLPATRWAVGDAGVLVRPGSVGALARALVSVRERPVRTRLGERARELALSRFALERVRDTFAVACRDAMGSGPS